MFKPARKFHIYLLLIPMLPKLAAAAFKSQLEDLQDARANVKEVKLNLFAKWIDDGVLPLIDLKITE